MTTGIVSAVNRTITAPNKSRSPAPSRLMQRSPRNSGDRCCMSGQVIGVNAQIESDSGGNDGVGFAIPDA